MPKNSLFLYEVNRQRADLDIIKSTAFVYEVKLKVLQSYNVDWKIDAVIADMLIKRGYARNEFYCVKCNQVLKRNRKAKLKKTMCNKCLARYINDYEKNRPKRDRKAEKARREERLKKQAG